MTAVSSDLHVEVPSLYVVNIVKVQARLADLLKDGRGAAQWWVELIRHLDDLVAGLRDSDESGETPGLSAQLRTDAPHLLGRLERLEADRERIVAQVTAARVMASTNAGDPSAVRGVSRAVRKALRRVRRYQTKTSDVLIEAYSRDFGGE